MPVQTTFTQTPAVAYVGGLHDRPNADIVSYMAEGGPIGFGNFVTQGSEDNLCALPTSSAEVTDTGLGFAIALTALEQAATPVGYAEDQEVSVLRSGRIWLDCKGACDPGDQVFVMYTAGTDGAIGQVRSTDAGGGAAGDSVALPGAKFLSTLASDGIALVQVNETR